jgi:hypothetical protein
MGFSVMCQHQNNASPDGSSGGGGWYETKAEALKIAKQQLKQWKLTRRPERERDGVVFFADRTEPWPKPDPRVCTCHVHMTRLKIPVPRYGPRPIRSAPHAHAHVYWVVVREREP